MSTCKAALCMVVLYVASPLAWSQSPDCRPETVEYYIGRLHHTPPMIGCQVDAMSSYVGKYGYRTQIGYQSSPRPAGEIVFQYPSADRPLPSNRTFTLNVPNGSPQQPNNPQTGYIDTPSVIQNPKKTGHKPAALADVRVSNALSGKPPFHRGEKVVFLIVVENYGPSPARGVDVYLEPKNLAITGVSGSCISADCLLGDLKRGSKKVVDVDGVISADDDFSLLATVRHADTDPDMQNNTSVAGNRAQSAPPPSPPFTQLSSASTLRSAAGSTPLPLPPSPSTLWDWIKGHIAASIGSTLALLILASGGAVLAHRGWWRTRIKAKVALERAGSTRVSRPVPTLAPSVSLRVHLEPGSAGPSGRVPILKEEVCCD